MKPSLLYLRKYIDENYNKCQISDKNVKGNSLFEQFPQTKIFKEKLIHNWSNLKRRQFYFKVPKNLNAQKRIQHLLKNKSLQKKRHAQNKKQISLVQKYNSQTQQMNLRSSHVSRQEKVELAQNVNLKLTESETLKKSIVYSKNIETCIKDKSQNLAQCSKKAVRFLDPKQKQQQQIPKQVDSDIEDLILENEFIEFTQTQIQSLISSRIDHTKATCKSIKKIGYLNITEYFNQMKKVSAIKNPIIKQSTYYPLECMVPALNQLEHYHKATALQKKRFHQKLVYFQKHIEVKQDFITDNLNIWKFKDFKGNKSSKKIQKMKYQKQIEIKKRKPLLQYQSIIIVNCANKKYFCYNLSKSEDYTSFFKYTTPLLSTSANKQNQYIMQSVEDKQNLGLHLCCLLNVPQKVKECFFWTGRPAQYYQKDTIISNIDNFLLKIQGIHLFQTDKIRIVDTHGRNSYVEKKILTKCNILNENNSEINQLIPKFKSNLHQKISLGATTSSLFNKNFFQGQKTKQNELFNSFNQNSLFKKERNTLSTKGMFKMVYKEQQQK